ncbi:MAG: class I SAM-dependent methyltransferase [Candidatus Levybacteria bacterium]|nr:class I SAM-dependent methyltransferase [Candidatus Levybacteria bacterium]
MKFYTRSHCGICNSGNLRNFLNLGKTPLADSFSQTRNSKENYYPLTVKVCGKCKLVQLANIVDDKILFGGDYAFFTGASPLSIKYFKDYAKETSDSFPKQSQGLILEIASNDGTLLQNFVNLGYKNVLGVDPAVPAATLANKMGLKTIIKPFDMKLAKQIKKEYKNADLIIANNVIAHVDSLVEFVNAVKLLLDDEGIFIFECHYFPNLLFSDQFDNIYHEHRSYFSLLPLTWLFKNVGLYMFDIKSADTQGGSIRVFVSKRMRRQSNLLKKFIKEEGEMRLDKLDTYAGFQSRVNYIRQRAKIKLTELKKKGYKIYGYGASAKGNTMLNYLDLNSKIIDKIVDKTPFKVGKFTPGTKIPVVMQSDKDVPDYYLLLVWNYLPSILEREKEFRKKGGKFIVPTLLPFII